MARRRRRSHRRRYAASLTAVIAALGSLGTGSYYASNGISGGPSHKSSYASPTIESEKGSGGGCGKERWSIKTLTDSDAGNVDFVPKDSTVGQLGALPAPTKVSDLQRQPQEENVYRVRASVVAFKLEDDKDIHLAIADPSGQQPTMIAEFPNASCDVNALEKDKIDEARNTFVQAFGQPTHSFHKPTGCAILTGVFFFDRIHGQFGVAPNGAELHPVLSFQKVSSDSCTPTSSP
jgi:hypothetical protein